MKKLRLTSRNLRRAVNNYNFMERGLSLENYKKQLERQLAIIHRLLKQNEKNLSKYKDIDGKNVKVSYSNGKSQYYYIDAEAKRYVYLPKSDIKTVKE